MEVSAGQQALYAVLTLVLMFGMGSSLPQGAFTAVRNAPRAFLVGMACQFVWMPLLGWLAVTGLGLDPLDALGLWLMVSVGGGNASNMLTYLSGADVALSLTMTAASAMASVLLTPALLTLYAGPLAEGGVAVPLSSVVLTVAMMAVPVPLGMWTRARRPALAAWADVWGRRSGILLIAIILATSLDYAAALQATPARVLVACAVVSGGGMVGGLVAGHVARLSDPSRLAIAFEAGVQNLPAVLALVAISLPPEHHAAVQRLPLLYAATALCCGSLVWRWSRWRGLATSS